MYVSAGFSAEIENKIVFRLFTHFQLGGVGLILFPVPEQSGAIKAPEVRSERTLQGNKFTKDHFISANNKI